MPNSLHVDPLQSQKIQAARLALSRIKPKQTIAIGTGSTAALFIQELATWPSVHSLRLTSTSVHSTNLATSYGLSIVALETLDEVDCSIDGADYVDENGALIKGFGGALTREKIAACLAKELWIMIDDHKYVKTVPLAKIPCEIIPSAQGYIEKNLLQAGLSCKLRFQGKEIYITDNGGWILDIDAKKWTGTLANLAHFLKMQCGVIEHGLFLNFPVRLFSPSLEKVFSPKVSPFTA